MKNIKNKYNVEVEKSIFLFLDLMELAFINLLIFIIILYVKHIEMKML